MKMKKKRKAALRPNEGGRVLARVLAEVTNGGCNTWNTDLGHGFIGIDSGKLCEDGV
jgi:hypothetical protein